MSRENQVEFNKVKGWLVFEVQTYDHYFEQEVEFSCGEDIDMFFKAYNKKQWKELFYDCGFVHDICDVLFSGIRLTAKDEESASKLYLSVEGRQFARFTFDPEKVGEKNAEKLMKIREILGK